MYVLNEEESGKECHKSVMLFILASTRLNITWFLRRCQQRDNCAELRKIIESRNNMNRETQRST